MVKTMPGPARPATGPGPFYQQDVGVGFYPGGQYGGILEAQGTNYVPPPQPSTIPASQSQPTDFAPGIDLW